MTDVKTVAHAFAKLLKEGKDEEAQATYWADDVVSLEPEGEMRRCEGRAALLKKHEWWNSQVVEVHHLETHGPYLHGDQFALRFVMDVTMKEYGRVPFEEFGLYTVKDGKVVEERFFGLDQGA